jgi:RNA polymerase sigma factor (sigma-70 family)
MTPSQQRTDGELLTAFAADGSQAAFTELVHRHGAMVHGLCWRVLGDPHEAEDVTQAVFLTLARKAATLRKDPSVAGWLHHVAVCLACNARLSRRGRQQRVEEARQTIPTSEESAVDRLAFRAELDAAIDQLPERYRRPLVLFHLEAKSLDETGKLLDLNANTLRTRLGRARELLRKKLVRRGVTIGSVGALTVLLSAESGAAVLPPTLVASTVGAATGTAAVSASVAALTKGALHMLFIAKIKTVSLASAACLVVAGTGIVAANQLLAPAPGAPALPAPAADKDAAKTLTATVKAEKAEFRTDERLRFTVTFINRSKEDVILPVRDFLGSQSAGQYTPSIRNVTTKEEWQFLLLPSRAPVRLTQELLKGGATLDLAYSLPGTFAKAAGAPVPHLPAGKYELALTIEVSGLTLAPPPAAFTLVEPKPLTKEETAKIVGQAREALAKKLAQQAAAEKGQTYPGAVDWSSLKADRFVATVEPQPQGNTVKFSGDVPNSEQVVTWSVSVTDKGVAADSLTRGFVISSKQRPPVRPALPPQPN